MIFSDESVRIALPKIEVGLRKYEAIMGKVNKVDVSKDKEFQRLYNGFYKVRQRNSEFYHSYYRYMEQMKNQEIKFEDTIIHLYEKLGRIEPSFSSKLVATIDDSMPVWDIHVLNNLGLKQPSYSSSSEKAKIRRIEKLIALYDNIQSWYEEKLSEDSVKHAIRLFDEYYSKTKISEVKKIDLILWQTR